MHSDLSNKDQNKMSEALFWWIAASGELAASGDFISAWIKTSEIESRLQELKKINGAKVCGSR